MSKVIIDGHIYDDEEDYWKLLADFYDTDSCNNDDERYDGLTVEERNK